MGVRGITLLLLGLLTLCALTDARPGARTSLRRGPPNRSWEHRRQTSNSSACDASADTPSITAPHANIWNTLTKEEVVGLLEWLHRPEQGLNLTLLEEAGAWDNTVGVTELLMPNKTDALAFIDGGGPAPARNARVGVFFGATEEPYMQNFIVGPLPVGNRTTIAPLDFIYNKGDGRVPNYDADASAVYNYQLSVAASIADITQDLIGAVATGNDNDTAVIAGIDPLQKEGDRIIDWVAFFVNPTNGFEDGTLLQGGFYMKFDITSRDPTRWSCLGLVYNDIFYPSVEELRAAWEGPDFVHRAKAVDGPFGSTARQGEELSHDTLPAPAMVQTSKRYAVDRDNKYVKWMDFEFYLAYDRDTGLRFYEIKYKGERIIFELGLQEAHAHYAGNDPLQSHIAYLDTWYGLGSVGFSLVPGWDCPASATYLDSVVHDNAITTTHRANICMFEQDAGYPIRRHLASEYVTVTRNTQFVVRWIATVGNYDYLMDYVFNLDGTVEVKVRATGYIQGTFYANNEDYGYHVHDALSGSMHDHVINYKLDLDVKGTANSLERVNFVPHTTTYSWSDVPRNTMKIQKSWVETEDESKLKWAPNSAASYVVVNKDSVTPYGEYRGYKIAPNLGSPVYLTVQNSSNLHRAGNFATHNLFATRQKDTEPRSASAWNSQDPMNPLVDFGRFFDGESLDQEDLVIWFNLGMHHLPSGSDLPNTVTTNAQAGIAIIPHNYLVGDPSIQTSQSVHVDMSGEKVEASVFGGEEATCAYDMSQLYPDLSNYTRSEAIRKWPEVYTGGGL